MTYCKCVLGTVCVGVGLVFAVAWIMAAFEIGALR